LLSNHYVTSRHSEVLACDVGALHLPHPEVLT
jgi:hypothetical protein